MRIRHRQFAFVIGLLGSTVMISGCENGQSQQRAATSGPSPAWVEQYHREQLRQEYERRKHEEQLQGR